MYSRKRLCRTVGHRKSSCGMLTHFRPRFAHRRLGKGRRHRRSGNSGADQRCGQPEISGKSRQLRPRPHAHGGKKPSAANRRSIVERTSSTSRPFASGNRLTGLWATRPAQRIQDRSLHPVPTHDGPCPRSRNKRLVSYRTATGGAGNGDVHASRTTDDGTTRNA